MSEPAQGARVADRYQLLGRLGAGGMGVVHRARDLTLGRMVALKSLPADTLADERARARLLREARAAATLDHPGIAHVYDVVDREDGVFVVMELVKGRTLRDLLQEKKQLPLAEVVAIVREVASALDHAHANGIVHRDVKPDNVMRRDDGRIVVLDFGLARESDADLDRTLPLDASPKLTESGVVVGTTHYIAPEQARGQALPPTDQFALAATAFELLVGRPPWVGQTATHVLAQILVDSAPRATDLAPEIPAAVSDVLARGLAKAVADRYPSVGAFAAALADAAGIASAPIASVAAASTSSPSATASVASAPAVVVPSGAAANAPPSTPRSSAPLSSSTSSAPSPRRVALAVAALVAIALVAIGLASSSSAPTDVAPTPFVPLARDEILACPILEASGIEAPTGWLGAAAASYACRRGGIVRGASPSRQLVPAALLDLPAVPDGDFPDAPLDADDARARTLAAAADRAAAWLDGVVTVDAHGGFAVELSLHRGDGSASEPVRASGSTVHAAVVAALDAMSAARALPPTEENDPEVAEWTGIRRRELLLTLEDAALATAAGGGAEEACARFWDHARELPPEALVAAGEACPAHPELPHVGLDRSSPAALARTAPFWALSAERAEREQVIGELDRARRSTQSAYARSVLASAMARMWLDLEEGDRGLALALDAVENAPEDFVVRIDALRMLVGRPGQLEHVQAGAAWSPELPDAWRVPGVQDPPIESITRPYVLAPRRPQLGMERALRALADGDVQAARHVATRYADGGPAEHLAAECVQGMLDVEERRLRRAYDRVGQALAEDAQLGELVDGDALCFDWYLGLARVLGREHDAAHLLLERFLFADRPRLASGPHAPILLLHAAVFAAPEDGTRAIEAIRALRASGAFGGARYPFVDEIETGALRFHAGDHAGAVAAWRPLVGHGQLPVEAFDLAGEPELASRHDAAFVDRRTYAGASPSTAREAERALARGDRARAIELAQRVLDAWETADEPGPWVPRMRAVLSAARQP